MDTKKIPPDNKGLQMVVFFLLFASLVFSSAVYSNPSDVIIEYPSGYSTGEYDSVITFDSIRNELSADGEWIKVAKDEIDSASVTDGSVEFDDDINTEYVWRPANVDENWSPYTNGYWTYTNSGWMWVSFYDWGWRPYHYGRWWWSSRWGWVWSPGYIWAPAWVVWMFYDGYSGWYPLSPRVRWRRHHHHHHGYYCHHMRFRVRHWVFCHNYNFNETPINHTVIIDPYHNGEILKYSKFASNIEYANGIVKNTGPEMKEIEKSTGKKIVAEDVSKYNTTKKVNEIIKRNAEEIKEIEKKQAYKEQQKKTTREDNWESSPYYGTPKGDNENSREGKNNENVNKQEEKNNNNKRNENYNKTETPKQEQPKYEKKNESPKNDSPKQESPKYESPKKESPKNDSPKNESPPQKKESNDNSNKQDNETKSDNGKGNKR